MKTADLRQAIEKEGTMPYKHNIIEHLFFEDRLANALKAMNEKLELKIVDEILKEWENL